MVLTQAHESRLLVRDFSLDAGESGKKLIAFPGVKSHPTTLLKEGDRVGSLQAVFSPGHRPGHMAMDKAIELAFRQCGKLLN